MKRIGFPIVTLAAAYVLSVGPAFRLCFDGFLPAEAMMLWYPIRSLACTETPIGKALIHYQSWWVGKYEEQDPAPPEPPTKLPEPPPHEAQR